MMKTLLPTGQRSCLRVAGKSRKEPEPEKASPCIGRGKGGGSGFYI
jgi:hypothetical protein